MYYTTTITSKGRVVTIPKAIREKIGLRAGTRVAIIPINEGFLGKVLKQSRRKGKAM